MYTLVDPQLHEQKITLAQLFARSPYTLLYFYPKDDTPWCTLEAQEFTLLSDTFSKKWIQIVGVSRDSIESHCAFISKYTLNALYISDPELILHKQFGARGEKNNYGKIIQSVIRSTVLLDDTWAIKKQRTNVRATGHAKRVAARIDENIPSS